VSDIAPICDDLFAPEVIRTPYPYLKELREKDPVHWNPRWKGWVLTSYDIINQIHRNPALSNDKYKPFSKMKSPTDPQKSVFRHLGLWLGSQDPPLHKRLRASISKAFIARSSLDALEPIMRETMSALLEKAEAAGGMDLVSDVAYPLTTTVIASLLGMPLTDLNRVQPWAEGIAPIMFMTRGTGDRYRRAAEALEDMADYFRALVEMRLAEPRGDLISSLAAVMEEGGLNLDEVLATCMVVIFGGHETTKDLLCNGILALLENPDQLDLLRSNPDLIGSAVEEVLRFESPAKSTIRWATEETRIGDKTIGEGERILMFWAGANRDPNPFRDPDCLDISRDPNPHLAFGKGIHFCIGAPFARREGTIAMSMLFERFPKLRIAVPSEQLQWHPTIIMRGLKSLPLVVR
jgi:cytochrome P450